MEGSRLDFTVVAYTCVFVKTRVAAACVLYSMQGTPRQERNGNGSVGVGAEVQTGPDFSGCEDEAC